MLALERRTQLLLPEAEEAFLVAADLVEVDVVEAGLVTVFATSSFDRTSMAPSKSSGVASSVFSEPVSALRLAPSAAFLEAGDHRLVRRGAQPRMEVVGDEREREARLLRPARAAHERERRMLLGGECVAVLHGRVDTARGQR